MNVNIIKYHTIPGGSCCKEGSMVGGWLYCVGCCHPPRFGGMDDVGGGIAAPKDVSKITLLSKELKMGLDSRT